jgi:D-alanyl-lipoteichoic acid acyltransferase DltB (MBOAT superfamily)
MTSAGSILALLLYIVLGRLVIRHGRGTAREFFFLLLNLAGFYFCFCWQQPVRVSAAFAVYVGAVTAQHLVLRACVSRAGWRSWPAFLAPLIFLCLIRYVLDGLAAGRTDWMVLWRAAFFVGLSYQAFRCSRLALEIRNGSAPIPNLWEYLNFAFFLPTMNVGPINSYANYRRGFAAAPYAVPAGRAALRILVGYVKYQFLGNFFGQLGYRNLLLLDDHLHPWVDLPVAMCAYYLFIVCNFSGFCDMAIGTAALIGIPVPENFDNPLLARNLKEFWNRWHITLSAWMRDVVFSPLSKFLVRAGGPKLADHAVALTIFVVFLLIGIWHGTGLNYALFGLAQAVGVVTVHYYTIFLKKRLGREGFKAYNENVWIRATGIVLTFAFYATTLFLFANTVPEMKEILARLR